MNRHEYLDVDPRTLHLPPSRAAGADPVKLARQIALYGLSIQGMPVPWVYRGADGALMIYDGVTRASFIRVQVVGNIRAACGQLPTIGDYVL